MNERIEHLWELIAADKRKAAVLGALLLLALGMWARSGLWWFSPSPAAAAQEAQAKSVGASSVLASTSAEIAMVRERLDRREIVLPRSEGPLRDVFALGGAFGFPSHEKVASGEESPKSAVVSDDNSVDRATQERLARVRAVEAQASRLRLRSTMVGSRPAAVIEVAGTRRGASVIRPGQGVEGFTLLEVHSRHALLEKDGVFVELTITPATQ